MNTDVLIYCDESCPLQHDSYKNMVIGAISCEYGQRKEIYEYIRNLKVKYNIRSRYEVKFTKISASRMNFYYDLLNYLKVKDNLKINIFIANKEKFLGKDYCEDIFNNWYYSAYYLLLDSILKCDHTYHMMYDQKDKNTTYRMNKIKKMLNLKYLVYNKLMNRIQDVKEDRNLFEVNQINSKESEMMQLLDIVIGAVAYKANGNVNKNSPSNNKMMLINFIESTFEIKLDMSTDSLDKKINIRVLND